MVTEKQQRQLEELNSVFLEKNKELNLSAFRTNEACFIGNILDSVAAFDLPEIQNLAAGSKVMDAGTGGGFPFLPLAVCFPEVTFVGMDSVQKKLHAIDEIAQKVGLSNTTTISGRLEELGRDPAHREQYDMVTARALAPLNVLIEYTAPFIKPKGYLLAWKSMNLESELHESLLARAELSCHLERAYEYELPGDFGTRQILIFQNTSPTIPRYPREVGMPKKNPLL